MTVKKIALIGARLATNLGGPSLLVATRMALSKVFPEAEYILFVPVRDFERDRKLASRYGVTVAPFLLPKYSSLLALIRRWTGVLPGRIPGSDTIKALAEADIIIDIWGIGFSDNLTSDTFRRCISEGLRFLPLRLLGKPVVKYTAAFGPFKYRWNKFFGRLYLGHLVDLILARDEISRQDLISLGIRTPILLVPDTAFLLPATGSEHSQKYAAWRGERTLIGLSVSYQARKRTVGKTGFVEIMTRFVGHLIKKYESRVVIIPNEISKTARDDVRIAREIKDRVGNDDCDILDAELLTAQEIKGVINECDVVVATRYHTIVASLSLGIPLLAIGWHHKYEEVLDLFGQKENLCNIKELSLEKLVERYETLWKNREEVAREIESYYPEIEERIRGGAEEVFNRINRFKT